MLILWIIMGLIGLLAIASLMPFSLYIKGATGEQDGFSYRAALHWPWRFLGIGMRRDAQGRYIQLLCGDKCLYERQQQKKARKKKEKKKKRKKSGINLLRDRHLLIQLVRAGLKFVRDLLACFRRPRLAGDMEVGLDNPAAMGIVSGFLYAVSASSTCCRAVSSGIMLDALMIRPNYIDATLAGEVDFSTGARPARIVIVLIKLLYRLPIRGLLRLLRGRKKAAKEKEVS